MSTNLNGIIDQLKTLTLMEATELVSLIEETFNVDASAPVAGAVMVPGTGDTGEAAPEEKTTCDVTITEIASDKRVSVLKVIRKLTSLGLADAKAFTTDLPKVLKEDIPQEEAEEVKASLEEAGATVTLD